MLFNIDELLKGAVPGDLTLAECKAFLRTFDWWAKLEELSAPRPVVLHFMIGEKEAPDEMPVAEYRLRPNISIVIDHSGGGGGVKSKTPELT